MKKLAIIFVSSFLIVAAVAMLFLLPSGDTGSAADAASSSSTLVVYKSPTCGCCVSWAEYMEKSGFDVEVRDVDDLAAVKARYGVSGSVSSCHTAVIGDYVIEGHVPAEDVTRLLAERPAVLGIAVPGMPIGSPGMEQGAPANYQDFDVVTFDGRGQSQLFRRVVQP